MEPLTSTVHEESVIIDGLFLHRKEFATSHSKKVWDYSVWLEVPFSSLPGEQKGIDTQLPNGKNYGFVVNNQQIVANKAWCEANPAAAKLFSIMELPIADINAENYLMSQGQNKAADIERHTDQWIKAHQQTWNGWLQQARAAAK